MLSLKARLISLSIVFLLLAAAPCAAGEMTIVILGSSTAQGAGASSYQTSWAGQLTAALTPLGFTVRNASIGGTSTAVSLSRFDSDVTPYSPGFVILATSLLNEPGEAVQSYIQNTSILIRKVESIGAIPIVVAPYPNNAFTAAMYSSIADIYTALTGEGVPVLDFLDGTDDGQGHWAAGIQVGDGTHPNDDGHKLLFDSIPLGLFWSLRARMSPVGPHAFGSWVQETDVSALGTLEVIPSSQMGSWTVSFWTKPSSVSSERVLLAVNSGNLQLRRTGSQLELWNGGTKMGAASMSGSGSWNIALTYQSVTGKLRFYLNGQLQLEAEVSDSAAATAFHIGGVPDNPLWNATGDGFADILLYRAPLSPADITGINNGHSPWKSVEAWLPLTCSPNRGTLNLAANTPTVTVSGTWTWSSENLFHWAGSSRQILRRRP